MGIYRLSKYILVISVLLCITLIGINIAILNKKKNHNQGLLVKKQTSLIQEFLINLYSVLEKIRMFRGLLQKIRLRVEMVHPYSELGIRKKVTSLFLINGVILLGMTTVFIHLSTNGWTLLFFVIAIIYLADTLLEYFVDRLKNKILYQQMALNDQIRNKYYEYKMVDEAIYEASQELSNKYNEISIQAIKIYEVLMDKETEKEMIAYNEVAPNKYLKMLMGLSYMTKEFGDTQLENGASLYMKSLNYLNNEIRMEVIKRERLNYALKSLSFIVLAPVFFMEPIKRWASHNFMPLKEFYNSQAGFVFEMILLVVIALCFVLIRRIQKIESQGRVIRKEKSIIQKIYDKGLYKWIDGVIPKEHTKKHQRKRQELKEIISKDSIQLFYTRKFLVGGLCFVGGLVLIVSLKQMNKYSILNEYTAPKGFIGGKLSEEEVLRAEQIMQFDRRVIEAVGKNATKEKLYEYLSKNDDVDEVMKSLHITRIEEKLLKLKKQYFRWWELIVCMGLFGIGYLIPDGMVMVQKHIRKIDLEDEVAQLQTILLILMHIKQISVFEILEWLDLFAVYLKEPIGNCLNNYESGASQALEGLKREAPYPAFVHIINNLQIAANELSIEEAFDELESEKVYYQELRKMTNEKIIFKKQWMGQFVGFLPIYGLVIFYFLVPMLMKSMSDMNQYFTQLNL